VGVGVAVGAGVAVAVAVGVTVAVGVGVAVGRLVGVGVAQSWAMAGAHPPVSIAATASSPINRHRLTSN